MKKFALYIIVAVIAFQFDVSFAAKTGEVKDDSVFVDARLGIRAVAPKGWNIKVQKDKKKRTNFQRVVFVKKNFKINRDVKKQHGEYTVPTVTVFADSTSLSIEEYAQTILDQLYQVTSRNDILLNTELLSDTDLIDSFTVDDDGRETKRLQFKHRYKRFFTADSRSMNAARDGGAQLRQDFNIINVAITREGEWIIILYASCEREFYQLNKVPFQQIFSSFGSVEP